MLYICDTKEKEVDGFNKCNNLGRQKALLEFVIAHEYNEFIMTNR